MKDNCSQCGKALGYEKNIHKSGHDVYCNKCWEGIQNFPKKEAGKMAIQTLEISINGEIRWALEQTKEIKNISIKWNGKRMSFEE